MEGFLGNLVEECKEESFRYSISRVFGKYNWVITGLIFLIYDWLPEIKNYNFGIVNRVIDKRDRNIICLLEEYLQLQKYCSKNLSLF